MNRHTIPLGRILGIPVGLDYSWFLIFVLLTWTMAVGYYPAEFKNWPVIQYWLLGAATAIMLFVSVLLHELGHSVVAMRYNIPVRSITLFIFGGVSQISTEPPSATAAFWISIAGPAVSFALAGLFGLLQPFFIGVAPLLALFKYLVYINVALGVFNLIPGFPLDGGGVFRAIVWGFNRNMRRATLIAANVGRFIAYLFIIFGVWQIIEGRFFDGMWIAFIGWFLESAAVAQVQQQMLERVLAGHNVSAAMRRDYTAVTPDTTLEQLVNDHILGSGLRSLVVKHGDKVAGLLTLHHIKRFARSEWPMVTADQAMIPAEQMKRVRPDTELWAALEEMDRDGVNQLPVMVDGQIQGMLSREDVIRYLRTLQDYGPTPQKGEEGRW
jgi:Zn-dependent protease/CBS domain-containing protein